MGVLNLYTEFLISSDINRSYICTDWSMSWDSESKCMENFAMKKKLTIPVVVLKSLISINF